MKNKKLINLSSLLVAGIFAFSCTQANNISKPLSTNINTNTNSNISTTSSDDNYQAQEVGVVSVGDDTNPTNTTLATGNTDTKLAKGKDFNSQEVKDTLIAYQDTEGVFKDSEEINKEAGDAGFSVKAVNKQASDDIYNSLKDLPNGELRDTVRNVILKDLKTQQAQEKKLKAQLAKIQKRENIDKELAGKVLVHKNHNIKRSQVITLDNGDGTYSKITQVEFTKGKIVKVNKESKTYDKATKKLIKIIHNFIETAPNYSRESVRIVTFSDDGGRNVKTEATTKFKDGKVRVVSENKVLDKAGNGTATSIITIKDKAGKETTYNVESKITTGSTQSTVNDPTNVSNTVAINTQSNGTATVTTGTNTVTIDVSKSAEAQSSSGTAPATVSSSSPSPADSTSPIPSSTTASVATSPSATVTTSPTPSDSASPIPTASPTPSASPSA